MQIQFKTPSYAVEQAQVTINGVKLPRELHNKVAPRFYGIVYGGENAVRVIREKLFKPVKQGRYFVISKTYKGEQAWLSDTRQGFATYKQALKMLKEWKKGALPGAKFTIKSKLIG